MLRECPELETLCIRSVILPPEPLALDHGTDHISLPCLYRIILLHLPPDVNRYLLSNTLIPRCTDYHIIWGGTHPSDDVGSLLSTLVSSFEEQFEHGWSTAGALAIFQNATFEISTWLDNPDPPFRVVLRSLPVETDLGPTVRHTQVTPAS